MSLIGAPSKSTGYFKPADHKGRLVLFQALGVIRDYKFPGSDDAKDVTEANVWVLDGPDVGQEFLASKIGQKMLRNALNTPSQFVLGRLAQGAKIGAGIPWVLNEATSEEIAIATKFVEERGLDGSDTSSSTESDIPF